MTISRRNMDFIEALQSAHSKENADLIAAEAAGSADKFEALFLVFEKGSKQISQRAAWPLSLVADKKPSFFSAAYLERLITKMEEADVHAAVKRNGTRILQVVEVPKEVEGIVMDVCFRYVHNADIEIASKCNAFTTLAHLAKKYPEIKNEIIAALDMGMQENSPPSLCARRKSVMKILNTVVAP